MKVWIVLEAYDYEGYGEPEGVYSSMAAAQAKKAELLSGGHTPGCKPDEVVIFEREVSGMAEEQSKTSPPVEWRGAA